MYCISILQGTAMLYRLRKSRRKSQCWTVYYLLEFSMEHQELVTRRIWSLYTRRCLKKSSYFNNKWFDDDLLYNLKIEHEKNVLERRLTSSRKYTKVPHTRTCQPQILLGFIRHWFLQRRMWVVSGLRFILVAYFFCSARCTVTCVSKGPEV